MRMARGYAASSLPYKSRERLSGRCSLKGPRAPRRCKRAAPIAQGGLAMQASHGYSAYMSKQARRPGRTGSTGRRGRGGPPSPPTVQYTVRSVPAHVDKALRRKAQNGRKSLNEVLRDALIREAEGTDVPERVYTDLDALAGSWVHVPGFDEAIEAQDRVDEALWR